MPRATKEADRVYAREANWKARGAEYPTYPMTEWCELCGREPPANRGGRRLHTDHDHDTGKFRGWLCRVCNTAIGALGDDESELLRAITYLRKYKMITRNTNEDLV